ncbi:serine/threonine-protein phosphatase 4 regulatory subunit 2 [Anopheles arabiensis]|uniref:serine/threonine-protein phosphatase 4 regulatory subunit 2 n=1 Tax=Anopheles arabiensis TaxID=7173 RepID=UPI001AAD7E4C|nr:serine/threonine-protein phosphatase 4 regulatory subunit 2 [Anopheles arabiensis]
MTMENQEEILLLLERFTKSKQKDIPRELEDYLNFVARTGDTLYRWVLVKPLFREKLVNVITDFHHNTPSIADIPQCPNVDPFNFERMKRALLERLDSFNSAPFTVQRICELLTEPRKQYTRIDKFMRAVEKNILVVSTQEPGRRRSDSENGDSLDSIVNGDLEVNVDIEMDNEQFHLEADALLPDSSDAVGSLHGSLGSEVGTASSAQRTAEGNEVNGGGSFMNSDGGTSQPSSKGGLSSESHEGVIDTNENATDGDIAAPLLEASLEASSSSATSTASAVAERTDKSDEIEPAPLQEEAASTATEDKENTASTTDAPPAQTVREEEITSARDDGIGEAAEKQREDGALEKAKEGSSVEEEKPVDEAGGQSLPNPAASGEVAAEEQTNAPLDDGEPQAKMVKYADDAAPQEEKSNLCTSVIKADVHASGDDGDSAMKQAEDTVAHLDSTATKPTDTTVGQSLTEQSATGGSSSAVATVLSGSADGESTVTSIAPVESSTPTGEEEKDGQEHSPGLQVETTVAAGVEGDAPAVEQLVAERAITEPTSTEVTSTNASEMELTTTATPQPASTDSSSSSAAAPTSDELEMELATASGSAPAATPTAAEVAVEEVDMAGGETTGATEMTTEDPKQDDNVMDIDESSVEMMDQ